MMEMRCEVWGKGKRKSPERKELLRSVALRFVAVHLKAAVFVPEVEIIKKGWESSVKEKENKSDKHNKKSVSQCP